MESSEIDISRGKKKTNQFSWIVNNLQMRRCVRDDLKVNFHLSRKPALLRYADWICLLLLLLPLWLLDDYTSYKVLHDKQGRWNFEAIKLTFSIFIAVLAFKQWRANRHETSIDKYYDRLDTANRRLEVVYQNDQGKRVMHVFAELDKLEYVIVKYQLDFVSPFLVMRAIKNFACHCKGIKGFRNQAKWLVIKSAYLYETQRVVKTLCDKSPAAGNGGHWESCDGRSSCCLNRNSSPFIQFWKLIFWHFWKS